MIDIFSVTSTPRILPQSEDLFSLIESHEGKPLKLYVYNYERYAVE